MGMRAVVLLAASLVAVAACSAAAPQTTATGSLTVFAAASLKSAFTDLQGAWATKHPNTSLVFSFDASSALEAQIEQGAPADVFASADTSNPEKAVDHGFAQAPLTRFAGNLLTLVTPIDNPAHLQTPADLARPGVRIVAAGDNVPITTYANHVVANLAALPGYPPGFAEAVPRNVVSKEDNVRAVLTRVELGEADAGIVYVTDAKTSTKVGTIPIPEGANVPATYAAVVVSKSANQFTAAEFVHWLADADAQAVLGRYGFLRP
jgi:molybdate transport system substrate-binding protein